IEAPFRDVLHHTVGHQIPDRFAPGHPGAQYVVTAGEDVVGVLHIADLAQLLEPKRKMNT
ncbi:hypothetical protein ACFPZ4_32595, partial [Micromonospora harpali]